MRGHLSKASERILTQFQPIAGEKGKKKLRKCPAAVAAKQLPLHGILQRMLHHSPVKDFNHPLK